MTIILCTGITQDGGQFYDQFGDLIADYADLILDDYDIEGAQLARIRFADQFPEYAYRA